MMILTVALLPTGPGINPSSSPTMWGSTTTASYDEVKIDPAIYLSIYILCFILYDKNYMFILLIFQ